MSTAVYYSNHNMPIEDIHSKHTLPSLAQIMPPMGQGQSQTQGQGVHNIEQSQSIGLGLNNLDQQYSHDGTLAPTTSSPHQVSPTSINSNIMPMSNMHMFQDQKALYPNPSPDMITQSHQSTTNSTPASSFSSASGYQFNGNQMNPNPSSEKCVCKSSANRIPRPRNAFILFRQKYHQSVLDEGSVIRTNPEVSRELGRRWRALLADDKDHWNNLAEEEKKNHAKKYPGYRYTPRRNGKNKNCNACRQKALRQQQVQIHNQQMIQLQQEQYHQYLQIQQQQPQQLQQQSQHTQQQQLQQQAQQYLQQQPQQHQQQHQQQAQHHFQQQAQHIQQQAQHLQQPNPTPNQFVISSNSYQPPGPNMQFSFNNELANGYNVLTDKISTLPSMPNQQYPSQQLQAHTTSQPAGSGSSTHSDFLNTSSNPQFVIAYDQQNYQPRYNSLPTPVSSTPNTYGFDAFNIPHSQQ